jgi:hypothetical protein
MTQQGLACDVVQLPGYGLSGYVDLGMTLFGSGVRRADATFLYRTSPGGEWLSDGAISADNAYHSVGNVMYGLPCSMQGTSNTIRWDISENSLGQGMRCEMRIELKPDPLVFSYYGGRTFAESLLGSGHIVLECKHEAQIVGYHSTGRLMGLTGTSFYLADQNMNVEMEVSGLLSPSFAQEKDDGNIIILDSGNGRILEVDPYGGVVKQSVPSLGLLVGSEWLHYDSLTGNLLISGGAYPRVYEMLWDDRSYGHIVWTHGQVAAGSGTGYLDNPIGVSYLSTNRDVVLIADSGNDRVVVVDRAPSGSVESHLYDVMFGSASVPVRNLQAVLSSGGLLRIVENIGEKELFSTSMAFHPALARALDLGGGAKNGLPQYENLVFGSITRGVN